ncbi:hypothetical protein SAMN04488008_10128 [Maribacter orientalis]|uniref:Uncharacterized protein n=1 Tax=Maribacter orientalis TaxID=228957 RepID=A0A1H7F170_9FLAO|nr:hypothetical protein [Maribacter orientalis]SEK19841.1 hypothetical protein SAMN04488008_10128 [Maribacter orientalis]
MKNITRREFTIKSALIGAGLATSNLVAFTGRRSVRNDELSVTIPMPIQIVIDDVGWWSGEDGHKRQEPYRTGISRNHVPADYQAIVDLGIKLDVRPQAATILCEWDRENILRNVSTITWMREKWDNSKWVGPWLDEAADIIRNNQDHYELTMHGVGHEYWQDKNMTRAEWADSSGTMRPLDQVELHLDHFEKLLYQNRLGSFPTSFVPTAFLHGFGLTGEHQISMAGVVKKRGIEYINTPFYNMFNAEGAQFELFGIDSGVITIDRGEDLLGWDDFGEKPTGILTGPTCGLHWPNLLHEDPSRNSEIVDAWVKLLKPYDDKPETVLAKNSTSFRNQLVHHICSKVRIREDKIDIDFIETTKLNGQLSDRQLTLKIESDRKLTFNSEDVKLSKQKIVQENDRNLYTLIIDNTKHLEKAIVKFELS